MIKTKSPHGENSITKTKNYDLEQLLKLKSWKQNIAACQAHYPKFEVPLREPQTEKFWINDSK